MAALEALLDRVTARWAIPPERVLGHACVAPGRKADPAAGFDWRRLALAGRAVWLDPAPPAPGRARHRPRPPTRTAAGPLEAATGGLA
jgi:N-acetylmuramoyl-L-alanine amidase